MKRTAINYLSIIGVLLIAGSMLSCSPEQAEHEAAISNPVEAVAEQEHEYKSGIDTILITAMKYAHQNPDINLDSIRGLEVDCGHLPNLYDRAANEEQRQAIAYIGARLCEDVDHWVDLYTDTPFRDDGQQMLLDDRFAAGALYTVYLESGSEKALDWLIDGRSDGALAEMQFWYAFTALTERPFEVLKRLETLENGEMPHEESATTFSRWLRHSAPNEERQQIKQIRDRVCSADPNGFGCRYMDAYIKSIE